MLLQRHRPGQASLPKRPNVTYSMSLQSAGVRLEPFDPEGADQGLVSVPMLCQPPDEWQVCSQRLLDDSHLSWCRQRRKWGCQHW